MKLCLIQWVLTMLKFFFEICCICKKKISCLTQNTEEFQTQLHLFVQFTQPTMESRQFDILRHLPCGSANEVMIARINGMDEDQIVVIKMPRTRIGRRHLKQEITVLTALADIRGILPFLDSWKSDGIRCVSFEFYKNGDVLDHIANGKAPLDIRAIARIILTTISVIHAAGFAHLDIKPENILLDESFQPILTDFGFATSDVVSIIRAGTSPYFAPEIVSGRQYLTKLADIYSIGMTVFVMGCLFVPRHEEDPALMDAFRVRDFEYIWHRTEMISGRYMSNEFKSFISAALQPEDSRPDAEMLLLHPWLNIIN